MLYNLFALFNLLTGEGTGSNPPAGDGSSGGDTPQQFDWVSLVLIVVAIAIFVVFYFVNKKKQNKAIAEDAEKKSKLCAGTKILTIGGIIGVVVSVNQEEKSFILETEGTIMKFDMRAIYQMELPKGKE